MLPILSIHHSIHYFIKLSWITQVFSNTVPYAHNNYAPLF